MIVGSNTRRPRNVDSPRAAAILYGDWGTSKTFVIGLAFAVGGYGSFWLIAERQIAPRTSCDKYPPRKSGPGRDVLRDQCSARKIVSSTSL
jgi:hypothetical protein